MHAEFDRAALADALARVAGAVAGRTTRPVLAGVLVRAEPGEEVTLTATDTELGVRAALPPAAGPGLPGGVVVDFAKFKQVVAAADTEAMRLTRADNHGLEVRAGGRWTLPGYDPAEYPEFPAFPDADGFHEVEAGVLRALVRRTAFAADRKDSTRFALSGVLYERDGKAVRLVATDSKRLAVAEGLTSTGGGDALKGTHLIPTRALAALVANLGDDGETVRVCLRPNEALFRTATATVHTRLIEGRYPPYRDILGQCRKGSPTSITLPVGAFAAKVRQAAVMTDDENKRVDMAFRPGGVSMQARGANTGAADVELELPGCAGPEVSIAFDPAYLIEFLKAVDDPTVTLEVTDGSRPALFGAGDGFRYLVMPLAG